MGLAGLMTVVRRGSSHTGRLGCQRLGLIVAGPARKPTQTTIKPRKEKEPRGAPRLRATDSVDGALLHLNADLFDSAGLAVCLDAGADFQENC